MKIKKKDGKKKQTSRKRKPSVTSVISNLQRAIKRTLPATPGLARVTGVAAPYVPHTGVTHEQLKQVMARLTPTNEQTDNRRITSIDQVNRAVTYDEPQASARGAYTRPARW